MRHTPARYTDAKYDDVPADIRALFEKMRFSRRGIYLHGDVGTGKTHIAYTLADASQEKIRVRSEFWNVTELLREIRMDFERNVYDKTRTEEHLMGYQGLLFLDDVGSEKITEWVAETFYLILNKRYNDILPTVITSNLPIAQLADRIGDRTVSRIVEMCDVVELVGTDRRITNQSKIQVKV